MSADADERDNARSALHDKVCHQGHRYEAAAPTVPFLLLIVAGPSAPDRAELLHLLSELAVGWADEHLPAGVDIEGWRREQARMQATDRQEDRRARGAGPVFDDLDEASPMTTAALAAHDAVRAGLPTVRCLLSDPDPDVRAAAAYLLGRFPEEAAASIPPLRALRDVETVPAVTANALISLGLLSDGGLIDRMRGPPHRRRTDRPLRRRHRAEPHGCHRNPRYRRTRHGLCPPARGGRSRIPRPGPAGLRLRKPGHAGRRGARRGRRYRMNSCPPYFARFRSSGSLGLVPPPERCAGILDRVRGLSLPVGKQALTLCRLA
ncbi:HEAT repeat domain-containing protein [Actinomadura nitritigenes]|uniref:HEAT repeat domain-containing protein n=1 Tax=Actinomadura nitritigenes TaxID=134602 RepID=UPI00367CEF76